jgi:hypothetical protein
MDEVGDVAELQLDHGTDVVETDDLGEFLDDFESALDTAEMVVGQLQHEEVFKYVIVNH